METPIPTRIDAKTLNEALAPLGFDVKVVESTGSTNDDLKKEAGRLPHYSVLIAETQSKGRGRQDRRFVSQAGKGIYLSVLLKSGLEPGRLSRLSVIIACAVAQALQKYSDAVVMIKWPNDMLVQGLKLAGILIESVIDPKTQAIRVVVGIGINVHAQTFPPELSTLAGSLETFANRTLDRNVLIADLCRLIDAQLNQSFEETMRIYRQHLFPVGTKLKVVLAQTDYVAYFSHVDDEGALWVQDEHGVNHRLVSEEVRIRL